MKKLLSGVALGAMALGSAYAADGSSAVPFAAASGSFSASHLHIEALAGFDLSHLHLDALHLHIDPLHLHLDPLHLHIDPLHLHLDALSALTPRHLHLDALGMGSNNAAFNARHLHLDALSGNADMLSGNADVFWGTFEPEHLHLDALGLTPNALQLDAMHLHIDALTAFDPQHLHLDPLHLHLDALAAFDTEHLHIEALHLHLDALGDLSPAALQLGAMHLHLDALGASLEALHLHIEALSGFDALAAQLETLHLHLDALAAFDQLHLHLDALHLHLDALAFDELHLHLDALSDLQDLSAQLDALHLHLDALDMEELHLHIEALDLDALHLHLDALANLGDLSDHLGALGEVASMLSQAYDTYSGLLSEAEVAFGDLVQAQTGASFEEGFLAGFLEKHGLEGDGFADFLQLSDGERVAFLIDLSDQLTTFMRIDHLDHWMTATNWSPRLAEIAGYGDQVTVGVVDQGFTDTSALGGDTQVYGPVHEGQQHGLAVTGVIGGALDSQGVVGVAPEADIVLSNPFAAEGQAEIEDVTASIIEVGLQGASIVNLSLGEAGYTFSEGWVEVFEDSAVQSATGNALFVMAAGNDGTVQTTDVDFGGLDSVLDRVMIVGAIGLDGEIASFSNTPGDACFTVNGACTAMMDRFMVAPGQQILVATPDGIGRDSGTSFAAPMVSGAAALLQSRWGWLADRPSETAEILFRSATDLGDEGVDETYGWGLLNVGASQLPLSLSDLHFQTSSGSQPLLGSAMSPELLARLDGSATLTVFESIGSTYRDFEIPVGVLQAGAIDPSVSMEQDVERYFGERLGVPSGATQSTAGLGFAGTHGFTDTAALGAVVVGSDRSAWTLSLEAREPAHGLAVPIGGLTFETHGQLQARDSGMALSFGQGDGALAFTGDSFAMTSDHDIRTGGVNPMLGLASGGSYFHASLPVSERLTFTGGVTARDNADLVVNPFSGELSERIVGAETYRAAAASVGVAYGLTTHTQLTVGFTALSETDGFLGGQSLGSLRFGDTADSRSVTFGAESHLAHGVTLAVSGTVGRTTSDTGGMGLLSVGQDGVTTTAYQASVSKRGVFGDQDRLRMSFAQPLTIENGALEVQSLDVINRQTGELGLVADEIALNGMVRRYVGEVLYGTSLLDGRGELSVFGQLDTAPVFTPDEAAATTGLRFSVSF